MPQTLNYSYVLVVDDDSTDHTSELASEYGIRAIKHYINLVKGATMKLVVKKY